MHLAAQGVVVVRRRRAVDDLHVVLRAHLQEALEAGGGVFRALPLIAMRQEADEARHAQPFALAGGDELVEQHLRAVGEVAELRFPEDERLRRRQRVAVFVAEHRFFGEERVDDLIVGLRGREIVEWRVTLFGRLIDKVRMALGEGAAAAVLA